MHKVHTEMEYAR